MSVLDFSCFAYQRRKQPLALSGKDKRSNPSALTPIKATSRVTNACTIPETPPERLKRASVPRKRPQRKRPNRLLSTSEEEGEEPEVGGEGEERSGGLFRDVVTCKRRKRDPQTEVEETCQATEVVSWEVKNTNTCVVISDSSDEERSPAGGTKWRTKRTPSDLASSPRNSQRERLKVFNYTSPSAVFPSGFTSPVAHTLRSLPFSSDGSTLRNSPFPSNESALRNSPFPSNGSALRNLPSNGTTLRNSPSPSNGSIVRNAPFSSNGNTLRSLAFPSNRIVTHGNIHRRNCKGNKKEFVGGETANLKQLQELFPQHTKDFLEGVLERSGGNLTDSISEMIASNGKGSKCIGK